MCSPLQRLTRFNVWPRPSGTGLSCPVSLRFETRRSDADVVAKLGYFDEPHLARALRACVGRTAGQLREGAGGPIALDLEKRPDQRLTS